MGFLLGVMMVIGYVVTIFVQPRWHLLAMIVLILGFFYYVSKKSERL